MTCIEEEDDEEGGMGTSPTNLWCKLWCNPARSSLTASFDVVEL